MLVRIPSKNELEEPKSHYLSIEKGLILHGSQSELTNQTPTWKSLRKIILLEVRSKTQMSLF